VLRNSTVCALVLVCLGLGCCAPARPPGVPNGADAEWSLKGDWAWSWERTLHSGCAAWRAKDSYAHVQLVVDVQCEGQRLGYLTGRGISYLSFSDHIVFNGYWPWTQEEYFNLMVFDSEGMISDIRPCPHVLSAEDLGELRVITQEALAAATTEGERRVLTRIDERLAVTNGAALASGQSGCTDLPPNWHNMPMQGHDSWRSPSDLPS
jgi:hypothetical protein